MRVIHGINFFCVGIKAAVLLTEALPCMHWHAARVARSFQVVLALINLMTLTTVTRYVCICCEQRGTFTSAFSRATITRKDSHGQISQVRSCRLKHTRNYAGNKADQHHGGRLRRSTAAGPAPDLRHQPPGWTHFRKQNVGLGYTIYM